MEIMIKAVAEDINVLVAAESISKEAKKVSIPNFFKEIENKSLKSKEIER